MNTLSGLSHDSIAPVNRDISLEWAAAAQRLTTWTFDRLVNRNDVYGAYLPLHQRQPGRASTYTIPRRKENGRDGALTPAVVLRHFVGADHGHLIGLHAIGRDNLSRWAALDVDAHGAEAAKVRDANMAAGLAWCEKLRNCGMEPLLLDSNGKGGFHLLQPFKEPVDPARTIDSSSKFGLWWLNNVRC